MGASLSLLRSTSDEHERAVTAWSVKRQALGLRFISAVTLSRNIAMQTGPRRWSISTAAWNMKSPRRSSTVPLQVAASRCCGGDVESHAASYCPLEGLFGAKRSARCWSREPAETEDSDADACDHGGKVDPGPKATLWRMVLAQAHVGAADAKSVGTFLNDTLLYIVSRHWVDLLSIQLFPSTRSTLRSAHICHVRRRHRRMCKRSSHCVCYSHALCCGSGETLRPQLALAAGFFTNGGHAAVGALVADGAGK